MKDTSIGRSLGTILFLLAVLGGCGEGPAEKGPAPPAAAVPVSDTAADPLAPRYEATLAEGIDFRKPGYPVFVTAVTGISGAEPWGRWSDANLASTVTIRFRQGLPAKMTAEVTVAAFGPNLGAPIRMRIGQAERTIVHSDPHAPGTYKLSFESTGGVDTIEIIPPAPTSPQALAGTADVRKVGVGLVTLRVLD